jgi:hypothetical protein
MAQTLDEKLASKSARARALVEQLQKLRKQKARRDAELARAARARRGELVEQAFGDISDADLLAVLDAGRHVLAQQAPAIAAGDGYNG